MKQTLKMAFFGFLILSVAACSNPSHPSNSGGLKTIDTKDVKGEIDCMDASGGKLSYNLNGEELDAYKVEIGESAECIIYPGSQSFADEKKALEEKAKNGFDGFEILNTDDNSIFFKLKKVPFGSFKDKEVDKTPKEGYGFVLITKKDNEKNYILRSNGETPLDPIWSKEEAEKLLKIAKTFKAK